MIGRKGRRKKKRRKKIHQDGEGEGEGGGRGGGRVGKVSGSYTYLSHVESAVGPGCSDTHSIPKYSHKFPLGVIPALQGSILYWISFF